MKSKKFLAVLTATVMAAGLLAGCGGSGSNNSGNSGSGSTGSSDSKAAGKVYFLNFKPEQATQWEDIAKQYTKETGVPVTVQTAASGTYEQILKSEIAKKDAPTLFQINGPVGFQNWKEYCLDLSDTKLYSWLRDPSIAVKDGDGVFGIPYVVEGYAIIYNLEIMDKYFALDGAKVKSMEEINDFAKLQAVVEDMTSKKDDLGIEGVFASTSFAPGEDWRWQTHLMNLPIYYEYKDKGVSKEDEISFEYNKEFKAIFDLYLNNSITEPTMLGSKTVEDSMSEFALGKVAMVQNGNWAWGQISGISGNVVKEENVKMLPIYTGMPEDSKQGLCTGTENFFSVNSKSPKEDQEATIAFVEWLFSSDEGKDAVTNKLGFISPFNTFKDDDNPTDPLAKEVIRFMDNSDLTSVAWVFTTFPSQTFKDDLGAALLQYAQGQEEWDKLVTDTINSWKTEMEASNQ